MVESLAQMEETNNPENGGPVVQKHQALLQEENEGVELLENKYT